MGRQHVVKAGDLAQHRLEMEEIGRTGVTLVGRHHAGPLQTAHRSRAAVGEQVDQHVGGGNQEHVESGLADDRLALFARPHVQRFDDFDPERLDDGFHLASIFQRAPVGFVHGSRGMGKGERRIAEEHELHSLEENRRRIHEGGRGDRQTWFRTLHFRAVSLSPRAIRILRGGLSKCRHGGADPASWEPVFRAPARLCAAATCDRLNSS